MGKILWRRRRVATNPVNPVRDFLRELRLPAVASAKAGAFVKDGLPTQRQAETC
ncbi:MAG: hypothetical protein ABIF82_02815 [Planctomycetota bacterium]